MSKHFYILVVILTLSACSADVSPKQSQAENLSNSVYSHDQSTREAIITRLESEKISYFLESDGGNVTILFGGHMELQQKMLKEQELMQELAALRGIDDKAGYAKNIPSADFLAQNQVYEVLAEVRAVPNENPLLGKCYSTQAERYRVLGLVISERVDHIVGSDSTSDGKMPRPYCFFWLKPDDTKVSQLIRNSN